MTDDAAAMAPDVVAVKSHILWSTKVLFRAMLFTHHHHEPRTPRVEKVENSSLFRNQLL